MRQTHHSRRGSALIEFALGWGVLWMLFTGVFQFGYCFYRYNKLMTSTSNAALYAATLTYDVTHPDQYKTKVANMVVYGDPSGGTAPVIPGLTASNVNVNLNPIGSMPMDITITVQNFNIDVVFKTFSFTDKPRVTTVYMGNILCSGC
jgi:hypothetical protein